MIAPSGSSVDAGNAQRGGSAFATFIKPSTAWLPRSCVSTFLCVVSAALILAGSANAQIDQEKLFQQQLKQQSQATGEMQDDSEDRDSGDSGRLQNGDSEKLKGRTPSTTTLSNDYPDVMEDGEGGKANRDQTRSKKQVRLEHEQPTEYQQFVKASIGRLLPMYGSWLFEKVPSTYAPVEHIPVGSDYTVGPADEIDIRVWGQINFSQRLVVSRTGDIFIPKVGRVSLAGLRFTQLQDTIKSAIGRLYKNFDLSVNMGQLRSIQVLVVGYARRPGTYTLSSLSTMVNAIFASGGPSAHGSMREIQLKRGGNSVETLDLYDLLLRGDKSKDCALQPGDVIFIPKAGPRVAMAGSVETPAVYELRGGATMGDALDYSGGLSAVAAGRHAILQRINGQSELETHDIELDASGLSMTLRNGDIVSLLAMVPKFNNTVTLRGNLADPQRLPWHAGMKISDVIPNKEALLTRDYWREHNRLTATSVRLGHDSDPEQQSPDHKLVSEKEVRNYHDDTVDSSADSSLAAGRSGQQSTGIRRFEPRNDVQPPAADIDWDYAVIERLDMQTLTTKLIPFNLGKAVLEHDPASDLVLEANDVVSILSKADISVPRQQQTKYVRVEGEVKMAGVYSVNPGETLRDVVERAGGLTENAYLFGSQLTRESTRLEQQKRYTEFLDQLELDINQAAATLSSRVVSVQQASTSETSLVGQRATLEKLRHTAATGRIVLDMNPSSGGVDALPRLPLENGDRLYVPSVPSTVNAIGAVYNQSAFLYGSDRRLGEYLQDAGGITRYGDKGHMFVIRADGSVISRDQRSHLFASNFDSLRMYPGDTLVVPISTTKTTLIRGLLDWSQIISSFGIGAAAINVLK